MNSQYFDKNNGYNVSSKYVAINTANLVSQFEKAGFSLASSESARVRNSAKQGYQKHLLKFTHPDMVAKINRGIIPQIVLKNSYDGSSSFQLFLGVFRLVCSNGLIVGTAWESIRVRHVGANALDNAINAANRVASQVEAVSSQIETMQGRILSPSEIETFAVQASKLILPDNTVQHSLASILRARRTDDTATDLWTVFNRIQENVLRGGITYTSVNDLGRVRNNTRRAVRSIDKNIELNQRLWSIAEQFVA